MWWLVVFLGVLSPVLSSQSAVVTVAADQDVTPNELRSVRQLAAAGIERLAKLLPGTPKRPITFVVHSYQASVPAEQLDALHPGVPGYARLQLDEIHLVLDEIGVEPPNDLRTTIDHELVHILLDQHVGTHGLHVPRWFHEGLAQELAGAAYLGVREEDLAYRVHNRTYIPFADLRESFPADDPARLALAYGQSFSFVAFLRRQVGLEALLAVARDCGPELRFRTAFARRMRQAQIEYEQQWRDYILNESGAGYRVLLRNCFVLMIVAIGPLLALAVAKRRNREEALKQQMGWEEQLPPAAAPADDPDADRDADWDGDGWPDGDWRDDDGGGGGAGGAGGAGGEGLAGSDDDNPDDDWESDDGQDLDGDWQERRE